MAHQRKSELNRFIRDGVDAEIPHGLPSDDLHPDGEPNASIPPAGAPECGTVLETNESIDWGTIPGEEIVGDDSQKKRDKAA